MSFIIAIDGPAAAGKGTLARRLAAALDLPYLDTGLLYRAVGRRVLDSGGDPADAVLAHEQACALTPQDLARTDLRGPQADRAASLVATHPQVRMALVAFQRNFGTEHGAVLDGRDVGTAIFPDAAVKFFITASDAARAERRWLEMREKGDTQTTLAQVAADMTARDARDTSRAAAPLRAAEDAVVIDTTGLSADQVFDQVLQQVTSRRATLA